MKKAAIRALLFLLVLILALPLASCGEEVPDDAFFLARAEELIEKSVFSNRLFFIRGIPTKAGTEETAGYLPADTEALSALGVSRISDITEGMRDVFSEKFMTRFTETGAILNPTMGAGGTIQSYSYCYDGYDKDGNFTGVFVLADGLPIPCDETEYHYDTLRITEKSATAARLSLSVTVTREGYPPQDRTMNVGLERDTDGIFRLSTYTCVAYATKQNAG